MNEMTVREKLPERRMAVNMVCNLGSHLISAIIAFFLTPFLISELGVEAYGFYPVAIELMAVFAMLSGMLNSTATRYVAIEMAGGREENARRYFSTVFFSNVAASGILMLPMAAAILLCDRYLNVPEGLVGELRIFFLLILSSVLVDGIFAVFGAVYSVTERLDLRAGQQLVAVLTKAGLLWFLLGSFRASVVSVGVAVLAASFAAGLVSLIVSRHLAPRLTVSASDVSPAHLRQVVSSGFWYSFSRFGVFLITGAFLFAVNLLYGAKMGGTYSVALTVSKVLSGVLMVLAGLFMPVMEKRFAAGDTAALGETVRKGQKTVGFFALVGVAMCIGFCREFFSLWLGAENTPTLRLLTVLLVLPALSVASALPILDLALVMNRMRRLSLFFVGGTLLGLAAAIASGAFLRAPVLVMAAVSAGVQIVWYSGVLPLVAGRLLETEPLTFYLPVLRTYLGCAVAVGFVVFVKTVFAVDSWIRLFVMLGVCLLAVMAMGYLILFGKPKFKT